jgi:sugar lactone lactonase YvrE
MFALKSMVKALGRSSVRRLVGSTLGNRNQAVRRLAVEELEARLCLSNGPYLLTTSYGNDSVMRYDKLTGDPRPSNGNTGAFFVAQGSSPLSTPLDLLFTPDGYLLVDSAEDNDILRFDGQTGQYLSLLVPPNTPNLAGPTGMIFSPDGSSLFVASVANNRVLRFDYANGVASNPTTFISDPAINFPAALVFGPDGNLYVGSLNNSSVERYDGTTGDPLPADGQSGADFVPSGSGGLNRTGGVVFGPDGNLYVSSETSSEIMRYDGTTGDPLPANGQPGAVFVPQGTGLDKPAGIVFGPGTHGSGAHDKYDLYVVNINSNNIFRFNGSTGDAKGEFIPAGSGGLSAPRDVTFGNTDPSSLDYIHHPGHSAPAGDGSLQRLIQWAAVAQNDSLSPPSSISPSGTANLDALVAAGSLDPDSAFTALDPATLGLQDGTTYFTKPTEPAPSMTGQPEIQLTDSLLNQLPG